MSVSEDKMFAIEDNRDEEDIRRSWEEKYRGSGVIGTYEGLTIDSIENMEVFGGNGEKIMTLEELGYCFEVGV